MAWDDIRKIQFLAPAENCMSMVCVLGPKLGIGGTGVTNQIKN